MQCDTTMRHGLLQLQDCFADWGELFCLCAHVLHVYLIACPHMLAFAELN